MTASDDRDFVENGKQRFAEILKARKKKHHKYIMKYYRLVDTWCSCMRWQQALHTCKEEIEILFTLLAMIVQILTWSAADRFTCV